MIVYRICARRHIALDGEGAKLFGGRWNSPGRPAVYTSSNLSLAVLEMLVHLDLNDFPSDLVWLKIELPMKEGATFSEAKTPTQSEASAFGDQWLSKNRTLYLVVPSAVICVEQNIILNPLHPRMTDVKVLKTNPFEFDERLFKV